MRWGALELACKRSAPPVKRRGMTTTNGAHRDPLELMTVAEVARIMKLNPGTVRREIRIGHLRSVRLGRSVRVPRVALEDYLRALEEVAS